MIGFPLVLFLAVHGSADAGTQPVTEDQAISIAANDIWENEIGRGFTGGTRSIEVKLTRAFGTTDTGSNASHDLWLMQVQGGLILADVMEPEYWFGGNLEGVCQIIMGGQERPDAAYFFATNAGLRYHFRTGTSLVPFLSGSVGLGITDIDDADASGKFQFNEQIGGGLRYFFERQTALTLDYSYWHVSNGGIREPNDGVNAHVISLGLAWLF